jgi:hypothetical protein
MASKTLWSALDTFTLAIAGDSSSPTLKNASAGTTVLGNEIDNTSGKHQFALWQFRVRGQSAFTAGEYVPLWREGPAALGLLQAPRGPLWRGQRHAPAAGAAGTLPVFQATYRRRRTLAAGA